MEKNQPAQLALQPVGTVSTSATGFQLQIARPYRPALRSLAQFSHVIVLWWADRHDNPTSRSRLQTDLPYAHGEVAGVFACRAEYRPNPIGVTVCELLSIDESTGIIDVGYIDAYPGTPILDLKPYIPVSERVRQVRVPDWFGDWPHWFEDAAEFFSASAEWHE